MKNLLSEKNSDRAPKLPKLPPPGTPIAQWSTQDLWNYIRAGHGELKTLMGREPPESFSEVSRHDLHVIFAGKLEALMELMRMEDGDDRRSTRH